MEEKKMDRRQKYDQTHARNITLKLNRKTDADILAKLEQEPNRTGYIKRLIREDIEREENKK